MSIFTYAIGTDNKVYLSTNNGESWSERGGTIYIRQREIYADPNYLTKVWVGGGATTSVSPATLSTDAGLTFIVPSWSGGPGNFLQYQTIDSNTVYAASFGTIAKSTDGGLNFAPGVDINTLYPGATYVWSLHFYTTDFGFAGIGSTILASKLFRTFDAGSTWTEVTTITFTGNSNEIIKGITSSPDGRYVVLTTTYGIYTSDEDLNNWTYTAFPNLGCSNIFRLSSTEYFVAFYSQVNSSSYFYTSVDGGLTWGTTGFTATASDITFSYAVDIYMYTALEGHISISGSNLLYTNNGGLTFTPSNLNKSVYAFTVTEQICDECPEGYTKDGDECVQTINYPATYSLPDFVEIVQGGTNPGDINPPPALPNSQPAIYGQRGLNLMQTVSAGALPLLGNGSTNPGYYILNNNGLGSPALGESGYSPLAFNLNSPVSATSSVNTLWRNRLQNVGIWVNSTSYNCNPNETEGCVPVTFGYCVNPLQTKTYLIGIAGDNEVRFYVDGTLYVRLTALANSVTAAFAYWHVFPIQLTAGTHTITIEGYNFVSAPDPVNPASFGAEIYDIDLALFKTIFCDNSVNRTPAELEPYILFSTQNFIGTEIPDPTQPDYPGVWECADGSNYSDCFGVPLCSYVQSIPFVKCYYELLKCFDPETVMYTGTDLSAYVGMIIKLDTGDCWTVLGTTDFYTDPVDVVITASYDYCSYCLPSYKLLNCKDNETTIYTNTDLSAYVNPSKIIKIEEYPSECWQVGINDKTTFIPEDVTLDGDPFTKCVECNPTIYQLNNCFNGSSFILSDSDLAAVMGKVISIVGYPGLCFSVGIPTCTCIRVSGDLGDGSFTQDVQATGIISDGRNQYFFTNGGNTYFLNWNQDESRWELYNQTTETLVGYCPIDTACPYSTYWVNIAGFTVESCSTVLYDITVDKIYPDCECCITKSCQ